jgi:hypothetical protein
MRADAYTPLTLKSEEVDIGINNNLGVQFHCKPNGGRRV